MDAGLAGFLGGVAGGLVGAAGAIAAAGSSGRDAERRRVDDAASTIGADISKYEHNWKEPGAHFHQACLTIEQSRATTRDQRRAAEELRTAPRGTSRNELRQALDRVQTKPKRLFI